MIYAGFRSVFGFGGCRTVMLQLSGFYCRLWGGLGAADQVVSVGSF